ncbi:conserved hypothetical protein, partial [Ixodes scapularis]
DESKCFCKKCGTHVYPVERIIAEKHFYHKNCFRCKECNKLLSVDGYMSHEAEIYCKIHFKQLFQPKARFDNDAGPRRQKRHEMIIRENVPEELPPDVVRFKAVEDSGVQILDELLEVELRRHPGEDERTSTDQWEVHLEGRLEDCSVVQPEGDRLEKCRDEDDPGCHGQQPQTGVIDDSEDAGPEADGPATMVSENFAGVSISEDNSIQTQGLSSLKNQWESGSVNNGREKSEETREELAKLRKKMCLGRSESMRQVYQKAVEDANKVQAGRSELISVEGQEAKAISIKEKFETGVVAQETEAEKIERLNREKLEDLSVLSETGYLKFVLSCKEPHPFPCRLPAVIHEAKNIFKQLDAEVAKQSSAPTSLARSPSNRWSQPSPTKNAPVSPGEVVRSSDPVRDVEVETNELSERFKFFENYKVESKERKRFEMTPPREVKEPSPEFQVQRDPNADRAKSMRARFENWDAERIAQENKKNAVGAGGENEEECLPQADTAKNLRAKFEAIKDESVRREVARPKPKVNRFVVR